MSTEERPIIGVSCGDLNGIGMEVIMKTFANADVLDLCTPVVFASSKVASYHRKALDMGHFNFHLAHDLPKIKTGKANLINCWKEEVILEMGKASPVVGKYALTSLQHASNALADNQVQALVTAPIHKHTIQSEEFKFPGHTEFLEDRFGGKSMMMMVSQEMRMALATVHIPLAEVPKAVNKDMLLERLRELSKTLKKDFLIQKPKIAVLSLNPHAGDQGVIGDEDDKIVSPAIQQAFDEKIMAFGPFPSDSFFGSAKHQKYDAVLAMYHDQGLIPFKSLSFGQGVNYTAGLPVIRTSPDHGTGFDIAGQGVANESSFREALFLALELIKNRGITKEITAKPLSTRKDTV